MSEQGLERVRRVCLALPEAAEQEAWGEPTFRIRKKIFAMYAAEGNHHGAGIESLWCNAPLGVQQMLIRQDPDTYFSPAYVGVKGWIGIVLARVDDAELRELVVQSYCMIAPKKLAAQVDG
jgi:hypothetical protein